MATVKTIVLITGCESRSILAHTRMLTGTIANGGIGFETVAQLLEDGSKHVFLCSRSAEKGKVAVESLRTKALPGTVELLVLDVDSEDSISKAASIVEAKHGRLDVLVNNAAVGTPSSGTTAEKIAKCVQTNAIGSYLMVEAFAPLLKMGKGTPRIVNVSSGAGSVTRRLDPKGPSAGMGMSGIAYFMSKAALNMATASQMVVYGAQGIKVFSISPGFIVSNLGPQNKAEHGARPTSEGAAVIVKIVNGERDAEAGMNLRPEGHMPW
ncbi:hypothetical protein MRB53_037409 [Persea americana]|nr:hypothetical protein MRB53_037409 [Persea americana]